MNVPTLTEEQEAIMKTLRRYDGPWSPYEVWFCTHWLVKNDPLETELNRLTELGLVERVYVSPHVPPRYQAVRP